MKEIIATVTSKGQITIPAEVRQHLGIGERDKVTFVIDDDGSVHVRSVKYPSLVSLRGAAGTPERNLTSDEIKEIARNERIKTLQKKV